MSDQNSLATIPDQAQIALAINDAFQQGFASLTAAWNAIEAGAPDQAQAQLIAVNDAMNILAEQVALREAATAGLVAMKESLEGQRNKLIVKYNNLKADFDQKLREAEVESYANGYASVWEEGRLTDEIKEQAINEDIQDLIENAAWTTEKLRAVGETATADHIEQIARQALELREEAEKLIDEGNRVAFAKRPKAGSPAHSEE